MMRWGHCAAAALLTNVTAAAVLEGVVGTRPRVQPAATSWWLTNEGPESLEWKRAQLATSNTRLEFIELEDDRPLSDSKTRVVSLSPNGTFQIDLEPGDYLVRATHRAYTYPQILVTADVTAEASGIRDGAGDTVSNHFKIFQLDEREGLRKPALRLKALTLSPLRLDAPYPDAYPFNPLSYLKNPFVLMIGATCFISFVLPKITDNADMEEYRKEQALDNPPPSFNSKFMSQLAA